jgi:hypothetical protein
LATRAPLLQSIRNVRSGTPPSVAPKAKGVIGRRECAKLHGNILIQRASPASHASGKCRPVALSGVGASRTALENIMNWIVLPKTKARKIRIVGIDVKPPKY